MNRFFLSWRMSLVLALLLFACPGCQDTEEPALPQVTGVTAALGSASAENPGKVDTIIVSWPACGDSRVQGYAIYRAEQGIGTEAAEKSDFTLQAITIATRYVDDEVHTSVRFPSVRYFYQIAAIGAESAQGPMSDEVSIEFTVES